MTACRLGSVPPVELVVATSWSGAGVETLNQELIKIGHDLGPVSIDLRFLSATALHDHLLRSQPSRSEVLFDLALVPNDWLGQLLEREVIAEIPPAQVENMQRRLVSQALQAVSEHERVLACPLSAEVLALVYDPQRFPSPPGSLDEILTSPMPAEVLPLALNLLSPYHLAPFVSAYQGSLVDPEGNLLWHEDNLLRVLRHLAPLWARAGAWRACRGDDVESLQLQLFAEGKLASFVAGPELLAALEASGRPFAVMPLPAPADARHPARALVGYQCLAVLRESRWVDLALEVGTRLLDDDVNQRLNRKSRRLPVLMRSYQSQEAMASAGAVGFLRALEEGQLFPPAANWGEGFQRVADRLQRLRRQSQAPGPEGIALTAAGERP
ncbi:MAG: hypothetical protein V1750_07505 [Acidobacteriota bacterium]